MPVGDPAGTVAARPQGAIEPAVRVQRVSKTFALPRHRAWTLKERLRHPVASFGHDRLEALSEVSFEVAPGEFFAVIGRNGSGKSTLLRCIAGIYELDGGETQIHARVAPFIELGVGFHGQLSAPDNVTVAGTLMGLRPAEARRRFPAVISFAELEEFVDLPLANYSSGMQVRLAFSTSFQVDAEVLLFDEVLAVGDALFRRKCHETFERLISGGHTIIYVTHSLDTVKRFADRVLLLDRGRTIAIGEPEPVIEEYERLNRERERERSMRLQVEAAARGADGDALELRAGVDGVGSRWSKLRRFADVCLTLARAEFKLRYLDSVIGYAWALAQPLLMFAVLYVIWSEIVNVGADVADYPLKLLLGIALFTFFTEATGHALPSLVTKGTMLRKVPFAPLALPLSSVLTSSFVYALTLVIVFGFILASGIAPTPAWLELIPLLALLLAFTAGVGMLLSLVYAPIRDVQPAWVVVSRLLFFVTPVFYPIEIVPEHLQRILMLNPVAVVIVQARHVLIDSSSPTAAAGLGGTAWLAIPLALTAAAVAAGLFLYFTRARRLAERI